MTAARVFPLHSVSVEPDDAVLVGRIRFGDERAFATLYHRYARYLAGVVYRLMGHDADVDDIVQDTFAIASGGIGRLRDPFAVRRWLVTIAVRSVRRRLARRRRRLWLWREAALGAPTCSDPRDRAPADALYEALARIPDKLRIPWMLHRVEGAGLKEVALVCGVSIASVKRRVTAAQERIQRRLDAP